MITDAALAALPTLALAAYTTAPTWQHLDARAVLSMVDDQPVVAFPGTHPDDPGDWLTDFLGAVPYVDTEVGPEGFGWASRGRGLLDLMWSQLPVNAVFVGHSLGGALAIDIGARCVVRGRAPIWIETYGAPRVGLGQLAGLIAPIGGLRWRRGNDPVPDVPPIWAHDRALTPVGVAQFPDIRCHSMAGYAADVGAAGVVRDHQGRTSEAVTVGGEIIAR